MDLKTRLITFIKEHSFLKSDEKIFKLSSGEMSNFYFDLRNTTLSPEGQYLIGNLYCDKIEGLGLKPMAIGGLTMGADPVSCATAYTSFVRGNPIEAFVIRKEAKKYGLMRRIEGNVKEGDDVIIIDDVITTGGSTIKAIDAAKEGGLNIIAVIVLLDRCEKNGRQNIEALGYEFHSILSIRDFD